MIERAPMVAERPENALVRKLGNFTKFSESDRELLDRVGSAGVSFPPHCDLVTEDQASMHVRVVLEGFAYRYKLLSDGRRQIVGFLMPGDFCDVHAFILRAMDHSIATLSRCTVAIIPRSFVLEMTERPVIARALWWATVVDEAILREWLVNMGRRSADKRIAHLFCEIFVRLRVVGLTDGHFMFPVTQVELGDTMGLSTVHVNRTLQRLRQQNLITLEDYVVGIPDAERLFSFAGFNPNYLHLGHRDEPASHAQDDS